MASLESLVADFGLPVACKFCGAGVTGYNETYDPTVQFSCGVTFRTTPEWSRWEPSTICGKQETTQVKPVTSAPASEAVREVQTMNGKLAELLMPQSTEFWGDHYEFTPALVSKVYGDGKQLLQLFPINERPRYWVVRIDSKHFDCRNDDEFLDIIEDIYDAIDEEFGCPPEDDLGVGDERPYFPMFDGQGTSWHFVR